MKKIILITGFLGAGKTTFVNWLLNTANAHKFSVILNEFGDIKLESQFIVNQTDEVVELSSGCICCSAKGDIPRAIELVISKSPQSEYILIEASGLSDPDPVKDALKSDRLNTMVELYSSICIVDGVNYFEQLNEHQIISTQLAEADTIVINKVADAGLAKVEQIKQAISQLSDSMRVLIWDESLKPDIFFEVNAPSGDTLGNKSGADHPHVHEDYTEYWFKSSTLLSLDKFKQVLAQLPSNIVRCKGIVNTTGGKLLVQFVNGKFELIPSVWLDDELRQTAILCLGKNLDATALDAQFTLALSN